MDNEPSSIALPYVTALRLIDEAHGEDPNTTASAQGPVPYELHYAKKMTRWLAVREPTASPLLQLACRAQHFRRWEIPRSSYPATRAGYLLWRAKLKVQAADQVADLLASPVIEPALPAEDIARVAALVRKEGLGKDDETQVLEDVACLVFLDDQLEEFESRPEIDEPKMVGILQKTWKKMSPRAHALALQMHLSERAKILIGKALGIDEN